MFWKNWFQPQIAIEKPEFWQTYLSCFQQTIDKNTPLNQFEFVVFDTETTGLDIYKDKILSIGAVTITGGEINIADSFECYVTQQFQNAGSIPIHGIMPQNQHQKISELETIQLFLPYIKDKILIGHHVGFDMAILNQALLPHTNGEKLKNYAFDTAMLYHRLKYPLHQRFMPHEDYSLDSLSGQFNISVSDRHTAAGDAFITAILFLKLVHQLENQGVKTIGDLLKH